MEKKVDQAPAGPDRRLTGAGTSFQTWSCMAPDVSVPQAFIDAGDLPWPRLEPTLRRALAVLGPGSVAEVHTGDPATLDAIDGWCAECGHAVIHREPGDGIVTFWIGKHDLAPQPGLIRERSTMP